MRITGGLGGLTPLIKTWKAPKEVKTTGRGGSIHTLEKKLTPTPGCHCIICTLYITNRFICNTIFRIKIHCA